MFNQNKIVNKSPRKSIVKSIYLPFVKLGTTDPLSSDGFRKTVQLIYCDSLEDGPKAKGPKHVVK
jgi:hypothetical protein